MANPSKNGRRAMMAPALRGFSITIASRETFAPSGGPRTAMRSDVSRPGELDVAKYPSDNSKVVS